MWWKAYRNAPSEICNRALREVFTVGFVSVLPLLLGILIQNIAYFKSHPFSLYNSLGIFAGFLLSGQLFFYAMAFAGSIIFVASDDYNQGNFPPRLWFFLVAVVCSALSFAFIGLDPKLDSLNNPIVFVVSFLTYTATFLGGLPLRVCFGTGSSSGVSCTVRAAQKNSKQHFSDTRSTNCWTAHPSRAEPSWQPLIEATQLNGFRNELSN